MAELIGFLVFIVGMLLSIGLHEIGHLVPAKWFDVKVTQYMIGFGRTIVSRRRGETEYGLKWIPLGGYVRLVGMTPSDDVSEYGVTEADAGRLLYQKPWWKKFIVMAGGPTMNLLLAFVLLFGITAFHGVQQPSTTVAYVSRCILPETEAGRDCRDDDPATPAAAAGVREGDRIVSLAGVQTATWDDVVEVIRPRAGRTVPMQVERSGETIELPVTIASAQRPSDPDNVCSAPVEVGYLGVAPEYRMVRGGIGLTGSLWSDGVRQTAGAITSLPSKGGEIWNSAFGGERDECSPMSIVGAGRIGGELAAAEGVSVVDRVAAMVGLIASFNIAIAVFNLVPLLPLDGGHMIGALWEGVKVAAFRLTGRGRPAPVDVSKVMWMTYIVGAVLIAFSVLMLIADIVNPITLGG